MTLSADLKAIHEVGAKQLHIISKLYMEVMADKADVLRGSHEAAARIGTSVQHWTSALTALNRLLRMSGENTDQAANVMRMIAYAYAATDKQASDDLRKAAELGDHLPSYIYDKWV